MIILINLSTIPAREINLTRIVVSLSLHFNAQKLFPGQATAPQNNYQAHNRTTPHRNILFTTSQLALFSKLIYICIRLYYYIQYNIIYNTTMLTFNK